MMKQSPGLSPVKDESLETCPETSEKCSEVAGNGGRDGNTVELTSYGLTTTVGQTVDVCLSMATRRMKKPVAELTS